MEYVYADITITPFNEEAADMLSAFLGDIGFDSFEQTDCGLKAYIQKNELDEGLLQATLSDVPSMGSEFSYSIHNLEQRDWNEQWETEHFDPVLEREFGIKLRPRMAFGSGSHDTTHQITELLMSMDFTSQRVLDMGTGTGVLAIAMAKRGAHEVVAIDIDEFSVENAKENIEMNGLASLPVDIQVVHGDAAAIQGKFDTIVANIHKNIIKADIPAYVRHLSGNGTLILSGFFDDDVPQLSKCAEGYGLSLVRTLSRNGWAVMILSA